MNRIRIWICNSLTVPLGPYAPLPITWQWAFSDSPVITITPHQAGILERGLKEEWSRCLEGQPAIHPVTGILCNQGFSVPCQMLASPLWVVFGIWVSHLWSVGWKGFIFHVYSAIKYTCAMETTALWEYSQYMTDKESSYTISLHCWISAKLILIVQ
jgi:hypothetical protein